MRGRSGPDRGPGAGDLPPGWDYNPSSWRQRLPIIGMAAVAIVAARHAAPGATIYLIDAITCAIGGRQRWRTMPWVVVLFGISVGPLGAIGVLRVIVEQARSGAWCAPCWFTASVAVLMIGPAMDEVLATLQHLRGVKTRGDSVWRAFRGMEQ